MKTWLFLMTIVGLLIGISLMDHSCQRPLPWHQQTCTKMEQEILESTVRIVFHGHIEIEDGYEVHRVKGTSSHATVVNGRYLLTHNHFGVPLSQLDIYNQNANGSLTGLSMYRADGTAVFEHQPLTIFSVVEERGETVLLDFGTVFGEGYFTHVGIKSAPITQVDINQFTSGTEVALIEWYGGHTQVVWAQVRRVYQANGMPLMQVDHYIEIGASGGGVFLNGQHIGNNWGRLIETKHQTSDVDRTVTLVALNWGMSSWDN